jgi:peptidylprolyl isomerase
VTKPPAEYWRSGKGMKIHRLGYVDDYAPDAGFASGWPIAYRPKSDTVNLVHCYGYVGVARDLAPDTGTGAELYTVIGHAPRQLDRNITIVGRIIEGMDAFSSLPRGTGDLGFYADRSQDVPIAAAHLASDLPKEGRPSFQYMDTDSAAFAAYIRSKANRHDAFYERPAGGVDLCNVTVPLRPTPSR